MDLVFSMILNQIMEDICVEIMDGLIVLQIMHRIIHGVICYSLEEKY
jgi:hypothetical protein